MKKITKKYAFILTGFLFGYLLLVMFGVDISNNTFKLFIPVAVVGLAFGEFISATIKRDKTELH
ncbi:hypothetical protein [Priestia megaterium]|uniref:hypothetical protein n=1 Tax=Priestia megaterium TaxID=1404 RepID=UPI001FB48A17|nr:hypothetical protein [Priestia megaterium]